ncbi:hypothetical protein P0W64_18385 [Tsukamurella sp. 8F]|uniref:hypothetical protein n=1 Tax=unclassified Tsukamurella TaxID=2633480 RepID=UPI0023B9ED90|nr:MULTISPECIES: hypothetical protein [unclassified Tsukamurella]MDF0531511.1 hypothetical protein [Tsukamurella sp. 8J]MDF0588755.1 hypothetical protein [Tsukamurella sp. 8F]
MSGGPPSGRIEIAFTPSARSWFLIVVNLAIGAAFAAWGSAILAASRSAFETACGIGILLLGVLIVAGAAGVFVRTLRHRPLAAVDADGVTFLRIKDPELRFWRWDEIEKISPEPIYVRGRIGTTARFTVRRGPRWDALASECPRSIRGLTGSWAHNQTSISFLDDTVRPTWDDVKPLLERFSGTPIGRS